MDVHSDLSIWLSRARTNEMRRLARRTSHAADLPVAPATVPVTLRFAFPDDAPSVARLAVLDSSDPPASPVLVAEVGGILHAALSLADGHVVADPFEPTGALIELLRARAGQLDPGTPRRGIRWRPRFRPLGVRSAWR